MAFKKPKVLKPGDTVAVVSPSWGGPAAFPLVYENGLKVLQEWGLKIREYPTTRAAAGFLALNPQAKANDINDAFGDAGVKAIFTTIGGDDAIRILPFLDKKVIADNPKILIGFSDTTTLLTFCNRLGLVTFYGPSLMAGFAQLQNMPESHQDHLHRLLFTAPDTYIYRPYSAYSNFYPDWNIPGNVGKINELKPTKGWRFVQGAGIAQGELFGGCMEVLQFLNGTDFWPGRNFWEGKILFIEAFTETPAAKDIRCMLRNYGMQGIFGKIKALLFGRMRQYTEAQDIEFDQMLKDLVGGEFGNNSLPIVTNMDFGHTDPQLILPLGVKARVNCTKQTFELIEPAVTM